MHDTNVERIAEVDAFRKLDTSFPRLLLEVALAMAGQAAAALVARWLDGQLLAASSGPGRAAAATGIHVGLAALALCATSVGRLRSRLIAQRQAVLAGESAILERVAQQAFLADVREAMEMSTSEADAMDVIALAVAEAGAGPSELLVADASRAHLRPVVTTAGHDVPGCSVETPWACPAIRSGRTMRFDDSSALRACPRLRERRDAITGATCIPVTILGTPTAVLHATSTCGPTSSVVVQRLEGIAAEAGARVGVLRAMAESQLQAETDPLTGLLNRRALEERVRLLRLDGTGFAVAMADLDHFKQLNDRYGHETGDRALRTFARVLGEAVRAQDHVSRHGGEEFVVVLPGLTAPMAASVMDRVRHQLREAVGTAVIPAFTVSIGVADSTWSDELTDILRAADEALLTAKSTGRDRVEVRQGPSGPPVPDPAPAIAPPAEGAVPVVAPAARGAAVAAN